jgi:hypothetical protein
VASREWGQDVWLVAWAVAAGIYESCQMGMHVVGLGQGRAAAALIWDQRAGCDGLWRRYAAA